MGGQDRRLYLSLIHIFWHSYGCCDNHFEPHYWETDGEAKDCLHVKQWAPEHETDVAVEYIKNADTQKPFALFIAHNPPHMPFEMVPDKYLELYRDKTAEELLNRPNVPEGEPGSRARASVQQYFAAVSGLDEQLGRVLDAIDEKGIRDNTIVVYTSDHGEMMGSHGRMEKNSFYAESFQIPLLIRYPEKIRPRKTDMLLSTVDLMPTLLTMLGLTDQIPEGLRGQDAGGAILENRDCAIPCALYHLSLIHIYYINSSVEEALLWGRGSEGVRWEKTEVDGEEKYQWILMLSLIHIWCRQGLYKRGRTEG